MTNNYLEVEKVLKELSSEILDRTNGQIPSASGTTLVGQIAKKVQSEMVEEGKIPHEFYFRASYGDELAKVQEEEDMTDPIIISVDPDEDYDSVGEMNLLFPRQPMRTYQKFIKDGNTEEYEQFLDKKNKVKQRTVESENRNFTVIEGGKDK